MAILDYVFGPPGAASYKIRAAEAAGKLMDAEIQRNIEDPDISDDTILGRLRNDPALRNLTPTAMNERIQATIAALLVGGMPTITQAGFNIMKVLLSNKRAMAMARDAADQDDERLRRCLGEALRFRPVLPVIFRKCIRVPNTIRGSAASAGQVIGPVDWLGRPIPSGADVGVFAVTANFDPRSVTSPHKFDPDRPFSDSLAFGQGRHWCLGMPIAMAVLVNVFRPVLRRGLISLPNDAAKTTYFLDYFAENLDISIGNKAA
jgi:cytochrome P450